MREGSPQAGGILRHLLPAAAAAAPTACHCNCSGAALRAAGAFHWRRLDSGSLPLCRKPAAAAGLLSAQPAALFYPPRNRRLIEALIEKSTLEGEEVS